MTGCSPGHDQPNKPKPFAGYQRLSKPSTLSSGLRVANPAQPALAGAPPELQQPRQYRFALWRKESRLLEYLHKCCSQNNFF